MFIEFQSPLCAKVPKISEERARSTNYDSLENRSFIEVFGRYRRANCVAKKCGLDESPPNRRRMEELATHERRSHHHYRHRRLPQPLGGFRRELFASVLPSFERSFLAS